LNSQCSPAINNYFGSWSCDTPSSPPIHVLSQSPVCRQANVCKCSGYASYRPLVLTERRFRNGRVHFFFFLKHPGALPSLDLSLTRFFIAYMSPWTPPSPDPLWFGFVLSCTGRQFLFDSRTELFFCVFCPRSRYTFSLLSYERHRFSPGSPAMVRHLLARHPGGGRRTSFILQLVSEGSSLSFSPVDLEYVRSLKNPTPSVESLVQ